MSEDKATVVDLNANNRQAANRFNIMMHAYNAQVRMNETLRKESDMSVCYKLLKRMRIIQVTSVPYAAVTWRRGQFVLLYNPDWVVETTLSDFITTMIHEMYHILKGDLGAFYKRMRALRTDQQKQRAHKVLNIAMDAHNNELIAHRQTHMRKDKTNNWILPERMGWQPGLTSAGYYDSMMGAQEVLCTDAEEMIEASRVALESATGEPPTPAQIKDHIDAPGEDAPKRKVMAHQIAMSWLENAHPWGSAGSGKDAGDAGSYGPGDVPNLSDEELESLIDALDTDAKNESKKALQEARSEGSLPSHFRNQLAELEDEAQVHWTTVMSRLIARHAGAKRTPTVTRMSRRSFITHDTNDRGELVERDLPIPRTPGKNIDHKFVVMFAIDTSGSMRNEDIAEGLAEMKAMKATNPDMHVIILQCDTHLSNVYVMDAETSVEQYMKDVGRTSGGGTQFVAPFMLSHFLRNGDPLIRPNYHDPEVIDELALNYTGVDLIVYHTDGYGTAGTAAYVQNVPVLWTLPSNNHTKPSFVDKEYGTILIRQ